MHERQELEYPSTHYQFLGAFHPCLKESIIKQFLILDGVGCVVHSSVPQKVNNVKQYQDYFLTLSIGPVIETIQSVCASTA
jgi:hypothetical protein